MGQPNNGGARTKTFFSRITNGAPIWSKKETMDTFFSVSSFAVKGDTILTSSHGPLDRSFFSRFCHSLPSSMQCNLGDTTISVDTFSVIMDAPAVTPIVHSQFSNGFLDYTSTSLCVFSKTSCGTAPCLQPLNSVVSPTGSATICDGDSVIIISSTGCFAKTWLLNGVELLYTDDSIIAKTSGIYQIVASANSCSDTSSVNVTVNQLPNPVINQDADTLSTGSFATYQWLLNGQIINGATNSNYTAVTTGTYSVVVSNQNGCSDTSNLLYFVPLNIEANESASFSLSPNPVRHDFTITGDFKKFNTVTVQTLSGTTILQRDVTATEKRISIRLPQTTASGIYVLILRGPEVVKVVRLVVSN